MWGAFPKDKILRLWLVSLLIAKKYSLLFYPYFFLVLYKGHPMSLCLPSLSPRAQVLSLALVSVLFLSACSGEKPSESPILTPGATTTAIDQGEEDAATGTNAEEDPQANPLSEVRQAYAAVLDNPDNSSFNYETSPGSFSLDKYEYAIVEATGDDRPELLLKKMITEYSPVIVLTTSPDDPRRVIASKDVLLEGAAGAGGYRIRVLGSSAGDGLFQAEWHSIQPEKQLGAFTLNGDSLVSGAKQSFSMDGIGVFPGTTELNWLDSTDRSGLDSISSSSAAAPAAAAQEAMRSGGGPRPTLDSQPQAAANTPSGNTGGSGGSAVVTEGSTTRMTGVVRKKTGRELLQGAPNPGPASDLETEFWVLEFDSPQQVPGRTYDQRLVIKEADALSLTRPDGDPGLFTKLRPFEGKRATVTVGPKQGAWQSDASLPLGALRVGPDFSITAA